MEVAIIVISVVLGLAALGFIAFIIYKNVSAKKEDKKEEPKKFVFTPKEKPVKPVLTPEQKEEKKQNEHKSKTRKLSDLGLRKANEFKLEEDPNGVEVVGIIYSEKSRVYLFNPLDYKLSAGDVVVVLDQSNTKRTVPVVVPNTKVNEEIIVQPFKDILEVVYQTNEKPAPAPVVEEPKEETPVEEPVEEKAEEVVEEAPVEEPVQEESAQEKAQPEEQPEEVKEEPVAEPEPEPVVEETKEEESQEEPQPVEEPKEEEPVQEEPVQEEEKAEESAPVVAEEPQEEEAEDENDSDEDESDEETADDKSEGASAGSVSVEYDEALKQYRVIKIKRTYECKIAMLADDVKEYYDNVRNKLLSYNVKYSKTKSCEKFRFNKNNVAILKVAGKQACVYLALDPNELAESKYKGKDVSEKKAYASTPFQYKFKTGRKAIWAAELVDMLATKLGLEANPKFKEEAYAKNYPHMTDEELIEKGYMTKTETITNEPPKGFHKVEEIK